MDDFIEDLDFDVNEITETGQFQFGNDNDFNLDDEEEAPFEEPEQVEVYNLPPPSGESDNEEAGDNLNDVAIDVYGEEEEEEDVNLEEQKFEHRGSIFQQFQDDLAPQKESSPITAFESPKAAISMLPTKFESPVKVTEKIVDSDLKSPIKVEQTPMIKGFDSPPQKSIETPCPPVIIQNAVEVEPEKKEVLKQTEQQKLQNSTITSTEVNQPIIRSNTEMPQNIQKIEHSSQPKRSASIDEEMLEDLGDKTLKTPPKLTEGNDEYVVIEEQKQNIFDTSSQSMKQEPSMTRMSQQISSMNNSMNLNSLQDSFTSQAARTSSSIGNGVSYYPSYDSTGSGQFLVLRSYQMSELATSYNVSESKNQGDHHEYRLIGTDPKTKKIFDVMRRFRHFYILRACFILKFPAMYVPPLPQKQAVGNMNLNTIKLRVFILNRFIKQIALCPYLLESQEFSAFLHPVADLEKELAGMMQQFQQKPTWHISVVEPYYFIKGTFQEMEIEQAKHQIRQFSVVAKRMQSFLTKFVEIIYENEKKYDANRERIKSLNKFLYEYELQSVESYSPNMNLYLGKNKQSTYADQSKYLLFENPGNKHIKQNFDQFLVQMQNPFTLMRHWLKFEALELEAIMEAFETRNAIEKKLRDQIYKYRDDTTELKKLEQGSMTLKSIFQSKESIQRNIELLQNNLPKQEVEIANLRLHCYIVTLQQARSAIPFFQRGKFSEFYKNVSQFSVREIKNCEKTLSLFQEILGVNTGLIKENVTFWREREADDNSRIMTFDGQQQEQYNDF